MNAYDITARELDARAYRSWRKHYRPSISPAGAIIWGAFALLLAGILIATI